MYMLAWVKSVLYIFVLLFSSCSYVCLFLVQQPQVGKDLIHEVSRSHTTRTTVGRTPLDEWSACCRDLYLTSHNTHNRQTSMPLVGFEPTAPAGEWPQTYALDCVATGTASCSYVGNVNS